MTGRLSQSPSTRLIPLAFGGKRDSKSFKRDKSPSRSFVTRGRRFATRLGLLRSPKEGDLVQVYLTGCVMRGSTVTWSKLCKLKTLQLKKMFPTINIKLTICY